MKLARFSVENYKAFPQRAEVTLRPLTLLFGYNSVGKSALLRTLPLLAESFLSPGPAPLDFSAAPGRGATFYDIRSRLTSNTAVTFGVHWEGMEPIAGFECTIRDLPDRRQQVVERLKVFATKNGPHIANEYEWQANTDSAGQLSNRYRVSTGDGKVKDIDVPFRRYLPIAGQWKNDTDAFELVLTPVVLTQALTTLYGRFHWLQALRSVPPRREVFAGEPGKIKHDGSGATQILAYDSATDGKILAAVSQWFESATGHKVEIVKGSFSGRELFSCTLVPNERVTGIDIADTGEGMGQVLPVVTLLSMAKANALAGESTILVEHPELHLHPAAHSELAHLFCEVAALPHPPQMMVETHSENFLLRVQLAIANGDLTPDRVIVYWVDQSVGGAAVIHPIEFDELGKPVGDNWPPGVFSESVAQARELMIARKKRAILDEGNH